MKSPPDPPPDPPLLGVGVQLPAAGGAAPAEGRHPSERGGDGSGGQGAPSGGTLLQSLHSRPPQHRQRRA
eukprot:306774-Prorocentrum_minimum.AAC.1